MKSGGRLKAVVFVVVALVGLVIAYVLGGMSSSGTRVNYAASITDAASGRLDISMELTAPLRPFIDLYLRGAEFGAAPRVSGFTAQRGGAELKSFQLIPGFPDIRRVWLGFSREPVQIRYTVDAEWGLGADDPPRSYLGTDFGYLRAVVLFYTPFTSQDVRSLLTQTESGSPDAGQATLKFSLPSGWTLVSPWNQSELIPITALRNTYFGVGPFDIQLLDDQNVQVLLAYYPDLYGAIGENGGLAPEQVQELYLGIKDMNGFAPVSRAPSWALTLLPDDPIHGGAAGTNSLISLNNPLTVSHEMFHWWNGRSIQYTSDANWIEEGFTTYYAGKVLARIGVWSTEQQGRYIQSLRLELGGDPEPGQYDFLQASKRLKTQHGAEDFNVVYNGGALLAYWLDARLHEQGGSLDDIWPLLAQSPDPVSSQAFLATIEQLGGHDLATSFESRLH